MISSNTVKEIAAAGEKSKTHKAFEADIAAYKSERDKWEEKYENEKWKREKTESKVRILEQENRNLRQKVKSLQATNIDLQELLPQAALKTHRDAEEYKKKYLRCIRVAESAGLDLTKYEE